MTTLAVRRPSRRLQPGRICSFGCSWQYLGLSELIEHGLVTPNLCFGGTGCADNRHQTSFGAPRILASLCQFQRDVRATPATHSQTGMYIVWLAGNHGGFTLHTKSISSAKSALSRTRIQPPENLPTKSNSLSASGSMYVGHTGPVGEFRVRRAICCTFRTQAMHAE